MRLAVIAMLAMLPLAGCADKDPTVSDPQLAVVRLNAAPLQSALPAQGVGFLVSSDGLIVTTLNNVDGAAQITVTRSDGSRLEAQLVQADAGSNLAIISIRGKKLPHLKLQDADASSGATPGAHVRAVTPHGISHGSFDHWENLGKDIDFTAPITPHDAGAPLLSDEGLVMGVAIGPAKDAAGHYTAIPIWRVVRMMPALTQSPLLPSTPPD